MPCTVRRRLIWSASISPERLTAASQLIYPFSTAAATARTTLMKTVVPFRHVPAVRDRLPLLACRGKKEAELSCVLHNPLDVDFQAINNCAALNAHVRTYVYAPDRGDSCRSRAASWLGCFVRDRNLFRSNSSERVVANFQLVSSHFWKNLPFANYLPRSDNLDNLELALFLTLKKFEKILRYLPKSLLW